MGNACARPNQEGFDDLESLKLMKLTTKSGTEEEEEDGQWYAEASI